MSAGTARAAATVLAIAWLAACASAPPPPPPDARLAMSFEDKMTWILRLEEDRVLAPPAPPPPPHPVPQGRDNRRAVVPPPPPPLPDLPFLLHDAEPRVRRRAALAIGRTRLPEGVPPLSTLLAADPEAEVRQMAAFALGLIGDDSAAAALVAALADAEPLVHGRAAEALGLIGHKAAAEAVAAMVRTHAQAGALAGIEPDDLEYPKAAAVEALRLGVYALVRLKAYEALAAALVDNGRPISRWWPVAYAFRRVADPRGAPVLMALLQGEGQITRAFAARGLGVVKANDAAGPLMAILASASEPTYVRIEAARSLADLGVAEAADALTKIIVSPRLDANLRLEAATALARVGGPQSADLFVDLLTDSWPSLRAAAYRGLARVDADMFVTALSGLDPDPHWSVRAALAAALGTLPVELAQPRLQSLLKDADQRVIPAALAAVVETGLPDAEATLLRHLDAEDAVVRRAAVNGLVTLKSKQGIPALVAAYERAEKDPTYVARAAILGALVGLDASAARPLLERALEDRDWAVRVRAASLLRTLDPAADLSRMRPAPAAPLPELNEVTPMIAPPVSPTAYIDTEKGLIQIELAVLDAPRTVTNFISLARRNFLGATPFHRVVPNFVVQDGDPRGDGEGGPSYTIRDEINQRPYLRGTVGMALDWEDTGGSQFFITVSPQPHLDARFTVFGHVVAGMDVVDRLTQWDQIRSVRIWDGVNWIGPP